MKDHILMSKVVATATENTWAQAYSTLQVYTVLSLERNGEGEALAKMGKEVIERLTREFFALEDKTLATIKLAVENTISAISPDITYSIVLSTIVKNALYIVTAGKAVVLVKRVGKIGTVATGEKDRVISYSGLLQKDDIIFLATHNFLKKVPRHVLHSIMGNIVPSEIAENIAPLIHEGAHGTEAAIILEYRVPGEPIEKDEIPEEEEEIRYEPSFLQKFFYKFRYLKELIHPLIRKIFPSITLPSRTVSRRKLLLFVGVITLSCVFVVSIFLEKKHDAQKRVEEQVEETLAPIRKKVEEADALSTLNKSLAINTLVSTKETLTAGLSSFEKNKEAKKRIEDYIQTIESKLKGLGGESTVKNERVIFPEPVVAVTYKAGTLFAVDTAGTVFILESSGSLTKTIKTNATRARSLTSDDTFVYLLSENGVFRANTSTEKSTSIVSLSDSSAASIDTFLGNIYLLNSTTNSIEKYSSPSFQKSSYLAGGGKLPSTPVSMSIDASIWVTDANGTLKKYTKGKVEEFLLKGTHTTFGKKSHIYTTDELTNVYILDPGGKIIVVFSKTGEQTGLIEWTELQNAASFAVDEKNKKMFVIINSKLYSFDF